MPQLRPATKEDFKAILTINNQVQAFPWSSDSIQMELNNPSAKGVVAIQASRGVEEITGYIFVRISGDEAEVLSIGVRLQFQRTGIAQILLKEIFKQLPKTTQVLLLEVSDRNRAAEALYEKMGFETYHIRKSYYPDGSDALCMKLNLAKS